MRTLVLLLLVCVNAYADIYDYIDIKDICEDINLQQVDQKDLGVYSCRVNNNSELKENFLYELELLRIDEEKQIIAKNKIEIFESDIVKVCEQFQENEAKDIKLQALAFDLTDSPSISVGGEKSKWKVLFTFGPFLAYHGKMDLRIKNEDTDAMIRNLRPQQKHGLKHYKLITSDTEPFKFLDEPQNRITIEVVNDKMFFGIDIPHPKILIHDDYDTPGNNSNVDIEGVIAGETVNVSGVPLKDYIFQLRASEWNINVNAFAGKIFQIANKKDKANLEFHLGGGAGISLANGVTKYFHTDENGQRKLKINEGQGLKRYGWNWGGKSRLRFIDKNDRFNVTLNYDFVQTVFDGPVGDFELDGKLNSHLVGLSVGMRLDDLFKKKRKKEKRK